MDIRIKSFIIFQFLMVSSLFGFSIKDGFPLALENDMDFKINKNNLNNINIDKKIADSLLYPSVDFSAKVEASNLTQGKLTPDNEPLTKSDNYELKFTQPIFDGFESSYEKKLQEQKFKSAVYYLKETQNNIALNYAIAYVNTLREKDLLNLSKESLQISKDIFDKVYKKVNVGYGTKLEFDEVKANMAETQVNLDIQKINFKEAIENLKLYVQSDFDSSELEKPNLNIELPKNVKEALEIAYNENPSINVSKANVFVAKFEQQRDKKDFYPNLDFVGSYNINNALFKESDEEYNEYKVGFEVSYNLFNGGKDTLKDKKALQNIKDKELLVKKSEYQVKTDLRLAWNAYNLNNEKQESLKQYLIVKKDVLDATNKEFDLGLKDLNTLLETHIEYVDIKKDLIRNTYDLMIAKYEILSAMGNLSDVLEDKLPTLDKVNTSDLVQNMQKELDFSYDKDEKHKQKKLAVLNKNKKVISKEKYENPIKKVSFQNINYEKLNKNLEKNITDTIENEFKEKFLNASKNKYTINLAISDSEIKAQRLLDRYELNDNAFFFSFREVNPLQRIVMGIYDSKQEAKKALSKLHKNLKRNKPIIEKIAIKQRVYHKYHSKNELIKQDINTAQATTTSIEPLIKKVAFSTIEPAIDKVPNKNLEKRVENFQYNSFKDKFLNASKDKYTINLAYSDSEIKAQALLDKYGLSNNGFFFKFRYENPLQKIMLGVFDSKEEALKAMASLPNGLKINRPRVEKVSIKQALFHKYNKNYSTNLGSI
jgi:adhesin transport system outer membrane protein